ncbi:MAG: hypothetical protein KAQ62_02295, partial [Cyclobacteriaceae bacterium]|nr:hypothetical protein [Cyclobacteriaceae bacterium]
VYSYDDVFWNKIDVKAKRYYIHKALKTWTTDHGPTLTAGFRIASIKVKSYSYGSLAEDDEYWEILKKYNQNKFVARCLRGMLFVKMVRNKEAVNKYKKLLNSVHLNFKSKFLFQILSIVHPKFLVVFYDGLRKFPNLWIFTRLFFKRYNQIKS